MMQDTATINYRHKLFVERIVDFNTVWGLESTDGWAVSTSNDFEDAQVIPFWSDAAYARSVAKNDWEHYKPSAIPLVEFLENWLIGMYNDGTIVGTNWDGNMFGKETSPLDLALEIIHQLNERKKNVTFTKFRNLSDFEHQIRTALGA